MKESKTFGDLFKEGRELNNISLVEMSSYSEIDVVEIQRIEKGTLPPPASRIEIIDLLKPFKLEDQALDQMCNLALEANIAELRKGFHHE